MDPNTRTWIDAATLFVSGVMLGIDLQRRLGKREPRPLTSMFVSVGLGLMALAGLMKLQEVYLQAANALGLVLIMASAVSWIRWWLRDQKTGFACSRARFPFV